MKRQSLTYSLYHFAYCVFRIYTTDYDNNVNYYTLHIFVLYKSNKTIQMFFGKFADEGDNPVNNPNILNVEGDNRKCVAKQNIQVVNILK